MKSKKWVVKKLTESGWIILSIHDSKQDALAFWRGYTNKEGENQLVYEELKELN